MEFNPDSPEIKRNIDKLTREQQALILDLTDLSDSLVSAIEQIPEEEGSKLEQAANLMNEVSQVLEDLANLVPLQPGFSFENLKNRVEDFLKSNQES